MICDGERIRSVGHGWFDNVLSSLVPYWVNRYQWF